MKPKSHTLFHFTKNVDIIKSILKDGFWPRYCLEDFSWYSSKIDRIAFPMVCFCDIPLSRIDDHVDFYGDYGLGLTKEWGVKNGLNPVLYLSESSSIRSSLKNMSMPDDFVIFNKRNEYGADYMSIMSHIKPIEGSFVVGDGIIRKEFYQENEWRYLAKDVKCNVPQWLKKSSFEDEIKREYHNTNSIKHCSVKVAPKDIKYIFVKNDSNIPDIINFIQSELDHFSASDLKIMASRVTSLETIRNDI